MVVGSANVEDIVDKNRKRKLIMKRKMIWGRRRTEGTANGNDRLLRYGIASTVCDERANWLLLVD